VTQSYEAKARVPASHASRAAEHSARERAMRNFKRSVKKIDWSISLSVLFAVVLTFVAACVDSSGPIGAVDVIPMGTTVSSVKLTLAQPTIALGQTTQASVVATLSDGSLVNGPVDYSSQNPSVATVSSKGVVTALTAGVAMINAAVASHAASATITVKPLAPPAAVVAAVAVALDSTSLTIGHSTKASATVQDASGNLMLGQVVTWASLSPTIATVSSTGMVTAVDSGPAIIRASVSGISGLDTLVVLAPPVVPPIVGSALGFSDFTDGTPGPFNDYRVANITYPNDPTGLGHGRIARVLYTPAGGLSSSDQNIELLTSHHYRYGETIWFRADLYIPSTLSDGTTPKTAQQDDDTRKLLDYFNGTGARLILERRAGKALTWVAGDKMTGTYHEDIYIGSTGIVLNDDTWYTIEVKMVTNSADNVRDGILEVYVNNPTSTPSFVVNSGLGWITEQGGGTYFNSFRFGTQLTTYPGESAYSEYRYWDNVGFSATRMGQ
jgi:hypothetical protein